MGRGERCGGVGGSEVGALLGVHGRRAKRKTGVEQETRKQVVKEAPGLGAGGRAAGEMGSGLS